VKHANRSLSVVVPLYNEARNVRPVFEELGGALKDLGLPFEILAVDDLSEDTTWSELLLLKSGMPELTPIRLDEHSGQTVAMKTGIDRAKNDFTYRVSKS